MGSNGCVGQHAEANTHAPCLVVGRKGSFGKVVYSDKHCFVIDTAFFVDKRLCGANLRWLYYVLSWLELDAVSKDSAVPGLAREEAYERLIPVCPPAAQKAIAAFLDRETARIDALIEKKRRLIELLQEKRATQIAETVTRGMRAHSELVPHPLLPGLHVPKHWKVLRLRRVLASVTSGSRDWARYYADEGCLFLRIANLTRRTIDLDLTDRVHVDPPSNAEGSRTAVRVGDLLFSITAYLGSVGVVPDGIGQAYVSQHIALCRLEPGSANSRWVAYVFLSALGRSQLEAAGYGGTKTQLGLDDIKDLVLPLPPADEQDALVSHLDRLSERVERTSAATEVALARLQEYRAALISAAVTGQIDVRQAA